MTTTKHNADGKTVVIREVDTALFNAMERGLTSKLQMVNEVTDLLKLQHGEKMPSYAQYSAYTDALSQQIRDKGYSKSSNHFHVTFREVFTTLYGAIPVSMEPEARSKYLGRLDLAERVRYDKALSEARKAKKPLDQATALAVRAVKVGKKQVVKSTAGAPPNQTQEHAPSEKETLRQLVARIGMVPLLDVIVESLNAEKATESKGKALAQLTAQLVRELKPAKVA